MIVAGLTGGIATGKSTVSAFFQEAGASIIDADAIAHAVVRKGRPAWQGIVDHFGKKALLPSGELDRKWIGSIIFNDSFQQQVLNDIVHPYVFQEIKTHREKIAKQHPRAVVIIDIPLLLETGADRDLPEVVLVYAPEKIQMRRLMKRDNLSKKEAMIRIRAQMPIEEKKRRVQRMIDNSQSLAYTHAQTFAIYNALKNQR